MTELEELYAERRKQYRALARSRPCPTCNAVVGAPCKGASGLKQERFHTARISTSYRLPELQEINDRIDAIS